MEGGGEGGVEGVEGEWRGREGGKWREWRESGDGVKGRISLLKHRCVKIDVSNEVVAIATRI